MCKTIDIEEEIQAIIKELEKKPEPPASRSLAVKTAVMFDLVNSTAAKSEFGHSKGMNRVHCHNNIAAKVCKKYRGIVIKYIGDAVLASFDDPANAATAAVVFRSVLEHLNLPGEEFEIPLQTRISLTSGAIEEITTESGPDIVGQVVDKVARLQEVTARGQILADVGVVEQIRLILIERIPFIKIPEISEASELHLKGLKHPVNVLEITTKDKSFGNPPSQRGKYISILTDAVSKSKTRVWLSIRSMQSRINRRDIAMLQDHLAKAQKERQVDVRIITDKWDAQALKTAVELYNLGLNIRFCEGHLDTSINLVDKNIIILNSREEDPYFPRNKCLQMESYQLNAALAEDFAARWKTAMPAPLQLAEILDKTFKNSGNAIHEEVLLDLVRDRFGIPNGPALERCRELLGLIRNARFIFILGKPGTGKSCIRQRLSHRLQKCLEAHIKQIDDYDGLREMFDMDYAGRRFSPQKGGGFIVKDPTVLTDVLENICHTLTASDSHVIWMIEFARGQYEQAFSCFSSNVLRKSIAIHMSCTDEEIYKRLEARAQSGGASVSREVIEKYYKVDNAPLVCKELEIPCIQVQNDNTIEALDYEVEVVYNELKTIADRLYYN